MSNELKRFGSKTEDEINGEIAENTPKNTQKSRESVWKQFQQFLRQKEYKLEKILLRLH
jgi:hypothetical protein